MRVRLLKNQHETRMELDGDDITGKLTSWAVTVSPGEPSRVVLRGGLWSYEGQADVTVEYEHAIVHDDIASTQAADLHERASIVDEPLTGGFLGGPGDLDIHALVFSLSPAPHHHHHHHHRGGPR